MRRLTHVVCRSPRKSTARTPSQHPTRRDLPVQGIDKVRAGDQGTDDHQHAANVDKASGDDRVLASSRTSGLLTPEIARANAGKQVLGGSRATSLLFPSPKFAP